MKLVRAFFVVAGLMLIAALLVLNRGGPRYQSVTISDFSKPVQLKAIDRRKDSVVSLKLKIVSDLNKPMKVEIAAGGQSHYFRTIPASGYLDIHVDWYFPIFDLVFVDAESVQGSIDVDYFL